MTEHDALLAAVLAAPADDVPRLVMADHLDEHGSPARAEFIRVQCHEAKLSVTHDAECRLCCAPRAYSDCPLRPLWSVERYWVDTNRRQLREEWPGWKPDVWLARQLGPWLEPAGSLVAYRRGFVDEIRLRQGPFQKHAAELFRRHPITRVVLVERQPYASPRYGDDIPGPMLTPDRFNFGWCDNPRLVPDTSHIGPALWTLLPAEGTVEFTRHFRFYRTRQSALDALSVAAVLFARKRAGLPMPEPEPAT